MVIIIMPISAGVGLAIQMPLLIPRGLLAYAMLGDSYISLDTPRKVIY